MRTILWFIYFWFYLVGLVPKYSRAKKMQKENRTEELEKFVHVVVERWASRLLRKAGVQVETAGLENIPKEAALFVSNHQGNFDIPIMLGKLDEAKSIVAKIQLEKFPFISGWMKMFHCLFIDRENPRQCMRVLGEAEALLKSGKSVIIFPEGTRSKGDEIGEFKSGAFRTALKAKTPIVPVVIDGSYRVMEANGFWIKPAKVRLTVLPPIYTENLTKEEAKNIGEDIKAMIQAKIKGEL